MHGRSADAHRPDLESNRQFTDALTLALSDDPYSYRQYARKKVLAETCTTGENRDSVKYYMRCKHQNCPGRKTVRVFVPQYDFNVLMVTPHSHQPGAVPPKLPGQSQPQKKNNKKAHAEARLGQNRLSSFNKENCSIDYNSLPAEVQASLMLQALSQLSRQPTLAPPPAVLASDEDSQTDVVLNLLAMQSLAQEGQRMSQQPAQEATCPTPRSLFKPACTSAHVDIVPRSNSRSRSGAAPPETPQQRRSPAEVCDGAGTSTRPSTRSQQCSFATILGRPVSVLKRPRTQQTDLEQRRRMGQEAPREHMGRKTQSKAKRNSRYTTALRALERSQEQDEYDDLGDGLIESCTTAFCAHGCSNTGSDCERICSNSCSKHGGRAPQEPPHKRDSSGAPGSETASGSRELADASAVALTSLGAGTSQADKEASCRFVGIVSDVLANLRGV